jgi:hypothetical protein
MVPEKIDETLKKRIMIGRNFPQEKKTQVPKTKNGKSINFQKLIQRKRRENQNYISRRGQIKYEKSLSLSRLIFRLPQD